MNQTTGVSPLLSTEKYQQLLGEAADLGLDSLAQGVGKGSLSQVIENVVQQRSAAQLSDTSPQAVSELAADVSTALNGAVDNDPALKLAVRNLLIARVGLEMSSRLQGGVGFKGEQGLSESLGAFAAQSSGRPKGSMPLHPATVAKSVADPLQTEKAAVNQMRWLVRSGGLTEVYEGFIGLRGAGAETEARKLFAQLPVINGKTTATDLVELGVWSDAPKGLDALKEAPRYVPGRQVLVKTTVNSDREDQVGFMTYQEGGREAVTHKAKLVGENGDNFLVEVEGRREPLEVAKAEIFRFNHPHEFDDDKLKIAWMPETNYADPLMRAKMMEAALQLEPIASTLDFSEAGQVGFPVESTQKAQAKALAVLQDVVDIKWPTGQTFNEPGRSSHGSAARLAVRGVDTDGGHTAVYLGIAAPFAEMLGMDMQLIWGGIYRHKQPDQDPFALSHRHGVGTHTWLQVTMRPGMETVVTDPAWNQPAFELDKAYSKWGDRYPENLSNFYAPKLSPVAAKDVGMAGAAAS